MYDKINIEKIEEFLVSRCGYKSIKEAKENYKPLNFYPLMGDISEFLDRSKR